MKPAYVRFVFNPTDGEVELSHNHEGHPAHAPTHRDLADGHSVHGYAYRIQGGWRVTDYEHKPLNDTFIAARVVDRLTRDEPLMSADK